MILKQKAGVQKSDWGIKITTSDLKGLRFEVSYKSTITKSKYNKVCTFQVSAPKEKNTVYTLTPFLRLLWAGHQERRAQHQNEMTPRSSCGLTEPQPPSLKSVHLFPSPVYSSNLGVDGHPPELWFLASTTFFLKHSGGNTFTLYANKLNMHTAHTYKTHT